jgi:aldose 1-epimerase
MITISNALSRLSADPADGGLILSYQVMHAGKMQDVFHAPAEKRVVGGFAWHGCWPLIPFANRAFGGIVRTPDGPLTLPLNDPANDAAMHGFAANAAWSVESRTASSLTLVNTKQDGEDPYRYQARQVIALEGDGALSITISVTSTADRVLPYGIGLHPWFPCDDDTTFEAKATEAVRFGPGYRPIGSGPVDETSDWREPKLLRGTEKVANFLDWDGTATFRYPSRGTAIRIEADSALRFGLLWTPGDQDFACFEPQSHIIGAPSEELAQALSPLKVLAKGETLTGTMRVAMVGL